MNNLAFRAASVLAINVLICGGVFGSYLANPEMGRTLSMFVAGVIVGLGFTTAAWPISRRLDIHYQSKNNLLVLIHVILGIVVFSMAASIAGGSVYKIFDAKDLGFGMVVLAGSIFGMLMGFGALLDHGLLRLHKQISWFEITIGVFGLLWAIVWYFAADGRIFIIGVVTVRVLSSIAVNRVFVDKIEDRIAALRIFTVSLSLIVLPWTAFLSK